MIFNYWQYEYLKKNKIKEVYISELAADYCVKYTAIDSVHEGFNTFIIKDVVNWVNINSNDSQLAFDEMKSSGIKIICSKKMLRK